MTFLVHRAVSLATAAAVCIAGTQAAAQVATGSFERTLDVDSPVLLEVSTGSGAIDIRPGPDGEVTVAGRIAVRAGRGRSEAEAEALVSRLESAPPIQVSGSRVTVGRIDDEELRRNVSISYEIVVPARTSARTDSGSGDLSLRGLEGSIDAETGSGDIRLASVRGDVNVETGSGSIDANEIAGNFNAETGSGSVRLLQSGAGDVAVSTGSGGIELRGVEGSLSAETGSGAIVVEGTPSGSWDLETGSGSIVARVPSDASFSVDARTSSGTVSTTLPIRIEGAVSRRALRGRVGDGGALLRAETGSGSIRIEER